MQTDSQETIDKAKIWAEFDASEASPDKGSSAQTVKADPGKQEEAASAAAAEDKGAAADQATAPQAAADATPPDDPYASLHPVIRDELRGLKAMLESASTQLRSAHGHIGGLKSEINALKEATAKVKADGGSAPTSSQLREARSSAGAMAKLKEDYPEFAEAFDAALQEGLQSVNEKLAKSGDSSSGSAERPLTRDEVADLIIETSHSGWKDTVRKPDFRGWLQSQPDDVRALGASANPRDAIRLLDKYAEARKQPATAREDNARLEAAAVIPMGRRSTPTAKAKPVDQMTKEEYWAYLDEQDRLAAHAG